MSRVKRSKIVLVTAPPGYGKTFFCMFICAMWRNDRIYSNIDFFKDGKKINKTIKNVSQLAKIEDSEVPGLIIMDEMGGNANPRRSGSDKNIEIVTELTIYPRKKNCSVMFCSQVDNMYDVYIRKTAFVEFVLLEPFLYYEDGKERLIFRVEIKRGGYDIDYMEMELFLLLDMGFSFNSSEKSIMDYEKELKVTKKEGPYHKTKSESKEELEKIVNSISI